MTDLSHLVEEYRRLVLEPSGHAVDASAIRRALATSADWTDSGAQHLLDLVDRNGSFVLRNACALAIALEMEDGSLGF